jgi:hypothetical protein
MYLKCFILGLLAILILPVSIEAGGYCAPRYYKWYPQGYYPVTYSSSYCAPSSYSYNSYCAPSYSYDSYCPPSYSYCPPTYYQPTYYTPQAVPVAVNPDYYYSTSGYFQNQLMMEMLNIIKGQAGIGTQTTTYAGQIGPGRQQQLIQQSPGYMQNYAQQILNNQQQYAPQQQQQYAPQQQQQYAPQQQQQYPPQQMIQNQMQQSINGLVVDAGPYQEPGLVKIVRDNCNECHNAKAPQGNFALMTADDRALTNVPVDKLWKAFGMVSTHDMPKNRNPITDQASLKAFYDWIQAVSNRGRTR